MQMLMQTDGLPRLWGWGLGGRASSRKSESFEERLEIRSIMALQTTGYRLQLSETNET
jgi:hypothetical protein